MLSRWRRITNLISEKDFNRVWERHIEDSISLLHLCPYSRRWLDIGSGAGFPGIVIGIILTELDGQIHCVESDGRKCAFLREVARELQIPVKVHNLLAENLSPHLTGAVDVVTARAFASVTRILHICDPYLSTGAVAVLPRGKAATWEAEKLDATRYTVEINDNPIHKDGALICIRERLKDT